LQIQGQTVLVTGGGGFIGSHLVQALVREGAHVKAFIRYNSANTHGFLDVLPREERREVEVIMGDLRDAHGVSQAVKGTAAVFHLGALIAIPYSYLNPTDVVQVNAIGTLNVAQAVLRWDVPRMIHTSTSETYGTARYVPMDESHPLQGQSPYSASKIAADKIVESFHCSYQLPVVTVRPFNAYGPRQSMRAIIPTIIAQALFRDEIVLGNLAPTRDFTYVSDTARAFVRAACSDEGVGEVFNAGSGFEISVGELAETIRGIVGREIPIRLDKKRLRPEKSEVDRLFSDSSKAWRVLGWKPQVSLEEGLARTIDWVRRNRHLFRPDEYVV
jgi:dTDP-glucose 4,6-dehydratase